MKFSKVLNYLIDIFFLMLKKNYIIVCSYPKTGSTILRMRLVAYFENLEFIDHKTVNLKSPEIGHGQMHKFLNKKEILVVKTHHVLPLKILNPLKVICVFRNPVDTMCSNFDYYKRLQISKRSRNNINAFIISNFGSKYYSKHIRRAINSKSKSINVFYEEYIQDPIQVHALILNTIGLHFNEFKIRQVIAKTSRKKLNQQEKESNEIKIKNFSIQKDYSNLVKDLDKESIKKLNILEKYYEEIKKQK